MKLADFEKLDKGEVITLEYDMGPAFHSKGWFHWKHDRVEGDRVHGRVGWEDRRSSGRGMMGMSGVEDFLYDYKGEVCCGSLVPFTVARRVEG